MSKNEVSNPNTFKLPISGDVVVWRELKMEDFDKLMQDSLVTGGKIYGFKKYLDLFIEKIENEKGEEICNNKGLKVFYRGMNPKDGFTLLNKLDFMYSEVSLILKQTGMDKEKKALVREFADMASED